LNGTLQTACRSHVCFSWFWAGWHPAWMAGLHEAHGGRVFLPLVNGSWFGSKKLSHSPWVTWVFEAAMKMMQVTKRVVAILFAMSCPTDAPLWACSMVITPRLSISVETEVFVGSVDRYIGPLSMDGCLPGESYFGLVVMLEGQIQGSMFEGQRVELYPYGLAAHCGSQPLSQAEVESRYPLGSRIRVLAGTENPCQGGDLPKVDGVVRLFASTFLGDISRVLPEDPNPLGREPFDYREAERSRRTLRGDAIDFEVVKDLVRLRAATLESERVLIMRRLTSLPRFRGGTLCDNLIKANIHSKAEADRRRAECSAADRTK